MKKVDLNFLLFLSASLSKNKKTFNKTEGELLQYVSIRMVSIFQ